MSCFIIHNLYVTVIKNVIIYIKKLKKANNQKCLFYNHQRDTEPFTFSLRHNSNSVSHTISLIHTHTHTHTGSVSLFVSLSLYCLAIAAISTASRFASANALKKSRLSLSVFARISLNAHCLFCASTIRIRNSRSCTNYKQNTPNPNIYSNWCHLQVSTFLCHISIDSHKSNRNLT